MLEVEFSPVLTVCQCPKARRGVCGWVVGEVVGVASGEAVIERDLAYLSNSNVYSSPSVVTTTLPCTSVP